MACFAVSRRGSRVSFRCFPQFFLLCSTSLVDRDSVPVFVYELSDELEYPVVSERVFSGHIVIAALAWVLCLSFCVLGGLPSFALSRMSCALVVGCGCVVELIGTSPCAVLCAPLPPPSLCCLGHVLERSSS